MTFELEAERNEWPPRTREDDLVVRMYTWGVLQGMARQALGRQICMWSA